MTRVEAARIVAGDHHLTAEYPRITRLAIKLGFTTTLDIAANFGADSIRESIDQEFLNKLKEGVPK